MNERPEVAAVPDTPVQRGEASPHGEPAKISAGFLRHPGHSRAAISSADATRGHRVTLKYFPLLEKGKSAQRNNGRAYSRG